MNLSSSVTYLNNAFVRICKASTDYAKANDVPSMLSFYHFESTPADSDTAQIANVFTSDGRGAILYPSLLLTSQIGFKSLGSTDHMDNLTVVFYVAVPANSKQSKDGSLTIRGPKEHNRTVVQDLDHAIGTIHYAIRSLRHFGVVPESGYTIQTALFEGVQGVHIAVFRGSLLVPNTRCEYRSLVPLVLDGVSPIIATDKNEEYVS